MKNLVLLVLLVFAVACGGSSGGNKKKNNNEVFMDPITGEKVLKGHMIVPIKITQETITVTKGASTSMKHENMDCKFEMRTGEMYYELEGDTLILRDDEGSFSLEKVDGPQEYEFGSWKFPEEVDNGVKFNMVAHIKETSMKVDVECRF